MKKTILTVALVSAYLISFCQTRSKQEIMDWICSKLIKYTPEFELDKIKEANFKFPILTVKTEFRYRETYKLIITNIDLGNLSDFELSNTDGGHLTFNGNKIATASLYYEDGSFQITHTKKSVTFYYVNWKMEENLQNRMKRALSDLIAILKKERQGENEIY